MNLGDAQGSGWTWWQTALLAAVIVAVLAMLSGCAMNLPTMCEGGRTVCAGPYLIEW